MKNDIEFKQLKGKVIEQVIRHNGNLIFKFTDETYTGIYNRAEIIQGDLELACKNYDFDKIIPEGEL